MLVLEFSKVVAAQLVNNDFSDINHMDHDPNMARFRENENNENYIFSGRKKDILDYY